MDTRRSSSRSTARPGLSILHGTSLRAMTVRVFLLDDHEVVRRGVRELLEVEDDLEVVGEAGTAEDERLARLTEQERKILDLIAEGLTNRQIGERMFLAEKTVKNYVSNLLAKLGMERRTEAAVFAARLEKANRPEGPPPS